MNTKVLEMKNITKTYLNGVLANQDVSFSLYANEIHAIVGENGAGKSTLMKILFGMEQPDSGDIILNNKKIKLSSSTVAIENKIGMVHQHFMLIESLSVAENVMLGNEFTKHLVLDLDKAVELTKSLSEKYQLTIDPYEKVKNLSVGMKQRLEILKVLSKDTRIIIMDEPTAVLTPQESKQLFEQLRLLKNEGYSIILITHKLKEVMSLCDRVTVMRKGKFVGLFNVAETTEEEISRHMIGRIISKKRFMKREISKNEVLVLNSISCKNGEHNTLRDIHLRLHQGEILGVAGIEGNGQKELVDIITGLKTDYSGEATISNQSIKGLSIREIRDLSVAYIPEDRMTKGINSDANIKENLISTRIDQKEFHKKQGIFLNFKAIDSFANHVTDQFGVVSQSIENNIHILSGGNIQKVVCARELSSIPKLIIAEQPTRGVDIGSMEFIHHKLIEMANQESSVLLISADLDEILSLSDSIIILFEGRITAYLKNNGQLTEEQIGEYMLGLKTQEQSEIERAMYE